MAKKQAKTKKNATKKATREPARKPAKSSQNKPKKQTVTVAAQQERLSLIQRVIVLLRGEVKQQKRKNSNVRNEYRFNFKEKHMNYIFLEDKGKYSSVGFTSKPTTFGTANMPLQVNPKKGDAKQSYIRNGVIEAPKEDYKKKTAKNYSLTGDDKANVKAKVRNYKKGKKKKCK
jgi:hypothetical protein